MDTRSPILVMLGHVDHGKTTLLDRVRGTAVALREPGAITQHISCSYIPAERIKDSCSHLLKKLKIELTIPGLLWVDSPGHEAFTTLRKRGGAIADLAVLIIDLHEGFKPQTDESLNYLKQFKTPFVVAATKIDKIIGWNPMENASFSETIKQQDDRALTELDEKVYRIVSQLAERGFSAERVDRVQDFSKQIAIVPLSSLTGEGISDLLVTLAGIVQKYLKKSLNVKKGIGKGTVLEVKEFTGLGTTIDVILYDGEMKSGDYIIIGGKTPIKTKIKAILKPKPLKEIKSSKDFDRVEKVSAAAGVKIAAPGLERVVAGSPLRAVRLEKQIKEVEEDLKEEYEEVEIETDIQGVLLKADTLGSLEALIKTFSEKGIPIRKASVGSLTMSDIQEMKVVENPIIFVFNMKIPQDIEKLATDNKMTLFSSDVIYKLVEDYEKWVSDNKRREEEKLLEEIPRPAKIRVLKGCIFRQKDPAIFGVEVLKGVLKPGVRLVKKGKIVGEIKEIQKEGKNIREVKGGDKAAVSMEDVTIGKHIKEGDELDVFISDTDMEKIEKVRSKLGEDELELLEEMKNK